MKTWALGLSVGLVLGACGGRAAPPAYEVGSGVGGAINGEGGGAFVLSGGAGIGEFGGTGGQSTTSREPTRRWFTVTQGGNSAPKLYLAGVRSDDQIEVHALPPTDASSNAKFYGGMFTDRGDKFCYCTVTEPGLQIWVVNLEATSFSTQELTLPADALRGPYNGISCGWLSETSLSASLWGSPYRDPAMPYIAPVPIVLSTDPDAGVLSGTIDSGVKSPDSKWSVIASDLQSDPQIGYYTLEVHRVRDDGMVGDLVLSQSQSSYGFWSADSRRFAVVVGITGNSSIVVYEFSESGTPTVIDESGPYIDHTGYIAFSPDNRFLVFGQSTTTGSKTLVRDLALGTQSELQVETGIDGGSYLGNGDTWVSSNRMLRTVNLSPYSAGVTPYVADISEASVAQGTTALRPVFDQNGNIVQSMAMWTALAVDTFVIQRTLDSQSVLQKLRITDSGAILTDLLPGEAGDSVPATVLTFPQTGTFQDRFLVASAPSYYYLEFDGSNLTRSVKLSEFFLTDYRAYGAAPGAVGLVAQNVKTYEFMWLSLEHEQPGPLIAIPVPYGVTIPFPVFGFPRAWPVF